MSGQRREPLVGQGMLCTDEGLRVQLRPCLAHGEGVGADLEELMALASDRSTFQLSYLCGGRGGCCSCYSITCLNCEAVEAAGGL